MGKSTINGPFSIAMLVYQRVYIYIYIYMYTHTHTPSYHLKSCCIVFHVLRIWENHNIPIVVDPRCTADGSLNDKSKWKRKHLLVRVTSQIQRLSSLVNMSCCCQNMPSIWNLSSSDRWCMYLFFISPLNCIIFLYTPIIPYHSSGIVKIHQA